MLAENKFSKYLLYAIGEIVLVVIGIFIALQLNMWNETRKTELKIITILSEVQKDLGVNIQQSRTLFDYYGRRDSLITLALNDKLTREHYLGEDKYDFIFLASNAHHLKIHDNGYQNLIENLDDIPDKFRELIEPLNEIYTYNKYEIDKFDKRIDVVTDRYMDDLAAKQPWYYKLSQDDINDSIVNYFLHEPFYKNALHIYDVAARNLTWHVSMFDNNAVRSYMQIRKLTGHPEKLPDYIPQNRIQVSTQQYEEFLGKYRAVWLDLENKEIVSDDTFTMSQGEDCLQLLDDEYGDISQLNFKSKTLLYSADAEVRIIRNSDKHLERLIYKSTFDEFELLKVE